MIRGSVLGCGGEASQTRRIISLKRDDENERIADLLVGLSNVHKTWGFGLCFLHLRNVKGYVWNHKRVQAPLKRGGLPRHSLICGQNYATSSARVWTAVAPLVAI